MNLASDLSQNHREILQVSVQVPRSVLISIKEEQQRWLAHYVLLADECV